MSSFQVKLQVGNLPSNRLALTNKIYISQDNLNQIANFYAGYNVKPLHNSSACYLVLLNGKHPYAVEGHDQVGPSEVAMNGLQRRFAKLSLATTVTLVPLQPYPPASLAALTIHVDTLAKQKLASGQQGQPKPKPKELDSDRLQQTVLLVLEEQVLETGQVCAIDFEGTKLELTIGTCSRLKKKNPDPIECPLGQLHPTTLIQFARTEGSIGIVLTGNHVAEGAGGGAPSIFVSDFDFEKLGIGGLDSEFNQIFRRAFASRIWPASIIAQMGITHVRGMLLYGPPGCGKTLIARQIGKALNAREPKIVNGPEILNK
jgi:vesicle-fusing ATPase